MAQANGAAPSSAAMVRAIDLATGAELLRFGAQADAVSAIAVSADGTLIAASVKSPGSSYKLQVWRSESGSSVAAFDLSTEIFSGLMFSPDGKLLSGVDRPGQVHIWNLDNKSETPFPSKANASALAFSPSGAWLAVAGKNIELYKLNDWRNPRTIPLRGEARWLAFGTGETELVAGLRSGAVQRVSLARGNELSSWTPASITEGGLSSINPDQSLVITSNIDGTTTVWSAAEGKQTATLLRPGGAVATAISFQPKSSIAAIAGADGNIRLFDLKTSRLLKTLDLGRSYVTGMAFGQDGRSLFIAETSSGFSLGRGFGGRGPASSLDLLQRRDYAILFATNDYDVWPRLVNPVPDAEELQQVLQTDYGFQVQMVRNPTRDEILSVLREAHQKKFAPGDQLLIFFAGHGNYDRELSEGFVIARDSRLDDRNHTSQLSYSELRSNIDSIPAQHILVAMDVCQGGMMLASGHRGGDDYSRLSLLELLAKKARLTTRKLVASGLDDYVSDGIPGHHSPFMNKLLEKLRSYGGSSGYITTASLFVSLEDLNPGPVMGDWGNFQPGSDFFFIPREVQASLAREEASQKPPALADAPRLETAALKISVPLRRSVAVLPFRNLRKDAADDYISAVLEEQLWSELNEAGPVRMVDQNMMQRVLQERHWERPDQLTHDDLAWISQNLGADLLLSGSYAKLGNDGEVQVNFQVVSAPDGRVVHRFTGSSKESELSSSLLRLEGARLRRAVGAGDVSPRAMTSAVPQGREAAVLYADALQKLRRNEFSAARDLLEKVVVLEPNFPLGHARLAEAYTSLGYDAKARNESKAAFELREAVPPNEAKLIEGRYHVSRAEWQEAIAAFSALWSYNPDTVDYAVLLADALSLSGNRPQALRVIRQVRDQAPAPEDDLRLAVLEAHAYMDMDDFKQTRTTAESASKDAERLSAQQSVAEALLYDSIALRHLGERSAALAAANRGLEMVQQSNPMLKARLLTAVGNVYSEEGKIDDALTVKKQALDVARAAEDQRDVAGALTNLGNIMFDRGDLDQAAGFYQEAIRVAQKIEDPLGEGLGRFNLASLLTAKGDLRGARAMLEQSELLYRTANNPLKRELASDEIGRILLELGEVKDAHRRIAGALASIQKQGENDYVPGIMLSLGDVLAAEGDLKEAVEQYHGALGLCQKMHDPDCTAAAQLSMANALLHQNDPKKAEELARAAIKQFNSEGDTSSELQARSLLAEALLRQELWQEAGQEVSHAASLHVSNRLVQLYFGITQARIEARAGQKAQAASRLEQSSTEALSMNARQAQLAASLAKLQIGAVESAQLAVFTEALRKEASDLGYGLIAQEAEHYIPH